jgi:hypothetical protein
VRRRCDMPRPRYLTKSRFKLALECETKLFYTRKEEYPDQKETDSFLQALADSGIQVGELAKLYYPGGTEVETLKYDDALSETNSLLEQTDVTIFEAAVQYEDLFIRVDILKKTGTHIDLIEVKAKSYSESKDGDFLNRFGYLDSKWKEYLYDVAFQKYVVEKAFPDHEVNAFLMLADKNTRSTVDALNQNFLIVRDSKGRTKIKTKKALNSEELGDAILRVVDVDEPVRMIYMNEDAKVPRQEAFRDWISRLSRAYSSDTLIRTSLGSKCAKCEFRCSDEEKATGKRNGFEECWEREADLKDGDFQKAFSFNLWDNKRADKHIEQQKLFLTDLDLEDIGYKSDAKPGLSRTERQWLQISKSVENDNTAYLDEDGLKAEMDTWTFPLHFIDFETTMVAIPFNAGRSPYEGIAFQFSHHSVEEDGSIRHSGQYLNSERGVFPNFSFIRALKQELDKDEGTIFRYAAHENSFLNLIYSQLEESNDEEVPDRIELMAWITTISQPSKRNIGKWSPGSRNMVDMLDLVKKYYYHPAMKGSNSIKQVLPAVLQSSTTLQEKYSAPIYGKGLEIPSMNYEDWRWMQTDDSGKIEDPYKLLPPVFDDIDQDEIDGFFVDYNISDGAAAMTAYARMQFTEMSGSERDYLKTALLKYCELDTFAMVLIWEYWHSEVYQKKE